MKDLSRFPKELQPTKQAKKAFKPSLVKKKIKSEFLEDLNESLKQKLAVDGLNLDEQDLNAQNENQSNTRKHQEKDKEIDENDDNEGKNAENSASEHSENDPAHDSFEDDNDYVHDYWDDVENFDVGGEGDFDEAVY